MEKPVFYMSRSLRVLFALPSAHYIVVQGQSKSAWVLLHQTNYYLALIFSYFTSSLFIQLIQDITIFLDIHCKWNSGWLRRLCWQLLLGIILILNLDVLLIKSYLTAFNMDFDSSGYMQIEFPYVAWMVFCR